MENKKKTPTGAQQKAGGNGECPTWRSYPDLLLKRLEEEDTRGWRCHWALLMGKVLEVRCTSGVQLAVQWARVELAVPWAGVELAVQWTRVELVAEWSGTGTEEVEQCP